MTDLEYNHFKNLVASVNCISSSPYKVTISPKRDDDSVHAVVTYDCMNRIAENIFQSIRYSRFIHHIDMRDDSRIRKFYFS